MDNTLKGIDEGLNERNPFKVIVYLLLGAIGFLVWQNNQLQNKLDNLDDYYKKEISQIKAINKIELDGIEEKYQKIVDRDREDNLREIKDLKDELNNIKHSSSVNNEYAKVTELKVQRNRRVVSENHNIIQ